MNFKKIKQDVKDKVLEKKTKLHYWYVTNEEKIWQRGIIVLPVIATVGTALAKAVKSSVEEHHLKLQQYDPATGYYNQLRRPLKSSDWECIMQMKREFGITLTECLIRLNLVK